MGALRVAVLSRVFSTAGGGAERYSVSLVKELAAQHEIHVFAQRFGEPIAGVAYHRVAGDGLKPRWVNQLWYAWASWRATRRGFDVVHSHENSWHGQVQTVHVLPVRHTLFAGRRGWRRLAKWVAVLTSPRLWTYLGLEGARMAPRPGRVVVAASASLRDTLAAVYPASAAQLAVLTPGVALPTLPDVAERPAAQRAAREALGLPVDVPCVLFVGNDYRRKGLDALLQALAQVSTPGAGDAVLAVVGQGLPGQAEAYARQAEALGLQGRVVFLGSQGDMGPAYRAADLLAHPTLEDTFAMVVLEAMAHGLPVVVSGPAHCGIASELSDGVDALVLPDPHDASALAQRLGALLGEAGLRARLGVAARVFAEGCGWPAIARRQAALYTTAAAAAAAASREG